MKDASTAMGAYPWRTTMSIIYPAARSGIVTGLLLAVARISGETAPLLFTALNNQFWSTNLNAPMANLPVVIFQFALSPYQGLAAARLGGRAAHHRDHLDSERHGHGYCSRCCNRGAGAVRHNDSFIEVAAAPEDARPLSAGGAGAGRHGSAEDRDPQARFLLRHLASAEGTSIWRWRTAPSPLSSGPRAAASRRCCGCCNRMYALYPHQRAVGEVLLGGRDILGPSVDVADLRFRVGMVFQKPTPFPMSIFDNVAFGLQLAARSAEPSSPNGSNPRCRMRRSGMRSRTSCTRTAASLSGGQQQRVCIARTIAVRPEVILFDEPTAALDPISTLRVEETLQALREKYCIVIVTHNLQQAARVSNVTGFMYMGELVEIGPSNELFTAPKSRRTDDYITGRFG